MGGVDEALVVLTRNVSSMVSSIAEITQAKVSFSVQNCVDTFTRLAAFSSFTIPGESPEVLGSSLKLRQL